MDLKTVAEELVRLSSIDRQELVAFLEEKYAIKFGKAELIDCPKDVILVSEQISVKTSVWFVRLRICAISSKKRGMAKVISIGIMLEKIAGESCDFFVFKFACVLMEFQLDFL